MLLAALCGFLFCLQLISATIAAPPRRASIRNDTSRADSTMSTIFQRRVGTITNALQTDPIFSASSIPQWMSSLSDKGKWPDTQINYKTGCDAQRAVWPAEDHWKRILVMSAAWQGGFPGAQNWINDKSLRSNISLAMNWWFENDFTNEACIDSGGTPACSCGTPGLWNTNWFSSIILIPDLVGKTCILLSSSLSPSELGKCTKFTSRAFAAFSHDTNGLGQLQGSNALDVARIGIDLGLLSKNETTISTAYSKAHHEYAIASGQRADGIKPDGSFEQHGGLIYSGNYGKDFLRDVLVLELASAGTTFAADDQAKDAVGTLLDGNKWMVFLNTVTGVLHWDFSVVGRMLTYAVVDQQATSSILVDVPSAAKLGNAWNSKKISDFATSLSKNSSSANVGAVVGNRMFYNSDYMVHRGPNYVSTLRMYSSRTANTECINSLNPFGFHLADGARYTYVTGNEYEDIFSAWDWNLIPGITTDYNATQLSCDHTRAEGLETFVGGTSNGTMGIGVMRYTNPLTKTFQFQKAWFFVSDREHVMVSNIKTTSGAPVYSVLDQKRHDGPVIVDGVQVDGNRGPTQRFTGAKALWHNNIGYIFSTQLDKKSSVELNIKLEKRTGDWHSIGPSISPPTEVDLFSAWLQHSPDNERISYTMYPGKTSDEFQQISASDATVIHEVQSDETVSAIYDTTSLTLMAIFWNTKGGSTTFVPHSQKQAITISADVSLAVIYNTSSGAMTVSDPTQTLTSASVSVTVGHDTRTLSFTFPHTGNNVDGDLGSSTTGNVFTQGKSHRNRPLTKLAFLAFLAIPVLIGVYVCRGRILTSCRVRRQMSLHKRRRASYATFDDVNTSGRDDSYPSNERLAVK